MRVFVIDASNMGPEFQGGLIGVVGSVFPTAEEKNECVDTVSRYAADGWAVAADPRTLIGRLAALTAEAACVPFVRLDGARLKRSTARTITATRSPKRNSADLVRSPFPASAAETRVGGTGPTDSRIENGGR